MIHTGGMNLFKTAEIAKFDSNELREYEVSVNAYREIKNGMDSAERSGLRKGRREGMKAGIKKGSTIIAKKMKAEHFPVKTISKLTGLTAEEIDSL